MQRLQGTYSESIAIAQRFIWIIPQRFHNSKYNAKAYEKMEAVEMLIKKSILSSLVAHSDETGIRVGGKMFSFM
ncbi:MAG: hypothetical protein IPJ13_24820 [Saprospiraceae bacterium]|nr:hypothetical protein [Saprospiraceae bacterium]